MTSPVQEVPVFKTVKPPSPPMPQRNNAPAQFFNPIDINKLPANINQAMKQDMQAKSYGSTAGYQAVPGKDASGNDVLNVNRTSDGKNLGQVNYDPNKSTAPPVAILDSSTPANKIPQNFSPIKTDQNGNFTYINQDGSDGTGKVVPGVGVPYQVNPQPQVASAPKAPAPGGDGVNLGPLASSYTEE